jgi:hypothetical protein
MRNLAFVTLLVLGACSDAPEQSKAAAPKAAEALQAGQWEVTSEVTRLTKRDQGPARIDTPAGTKETESVCIEEAEVKKPDPALFAGAKNSCSYDNIYMAGGRVNASLTCTRDGISDGNLVMMVDGDYQADSFEITRDLGTRLAGAGDVQIVSKVTGRRLAACAAG